MIAVSKDVYFLITYGEIKKYVNPVNQHPFYSVGIQIKKPLEEPKWYYTKSFSNRDDLETFISTHPPGFEYEVIFTKGKYTNIVDLRAVKVNKISVKDLQIAKLSILKAIAPFYKKTEIDEMLKDGDKILKWVMDNDSFQTDTKEQE